MEPLRIGLVAGDFAPHLDGVSDYTARLASALEAGGHEPIILARAGSGPTDRVTVVPGAREWTVRGVRPLAAAAPSATSMSTMSSSPLPPTATAIGDRRLAADLVARGRRVVDDGRTWDQVAAAHEDLYAAVL